MKTKHNRSYCFTSFNDEMKIDLEHPALRYVVYQREKAPTTGKLHYQGYIEFNKPIYFTTCQKIIGDSKCHIEIRKGTREQARVYCMKEETREEDTKYIEYGSWESGGQGNRNDLRQLATRLFNGELTQKDIENDYPHYYIQYYNTINMILKQKHIEQQKEQLKQYFKDTKLKEWQQQVLNILSKQNDREVLWIHDIDGNNGKTYLSKYLLATDDVYYCQNGKVADIAYAYNNQETVIFDLTRTQQDHINYSVIESFKNGLIFSSKYESTTKMFKPCKVMIMANFLPKIQSLSLDRWKILELNEGELGVVNVNDIGIKSEEEGDIDTPITPKLFRR